MAILVVCGRGSVQAHPHAWIDPRSKVLLDVAGRVRALELGWIFDDDYTVAIADEVDVGE